MRNSKCGEAFGFYRTQSAEIRYIPAPDEDVFPALYASSFNVDPGGVINHLQIARAKLSRTVNNLSQKDKENENGSFGERFPANNGEQ